MASNALSAPSDQELLAGADARIEKHRKAKATITVVDESGHPVPGVTLRVTQDRHAFLFGCNIFPWGRIGDTELELAYRDRYTGLLNFATLGFYWWSYEREQGKPAHDYAGTVADWCKKQGIATKGHPLAWNYKDPEWLPDDADEIYRLQIHRTRDCVKHFVGVIDCWDVVNEATHFDREEFSKRRSPKLSAMWKKRGQLEFTKSCFIEARKANPGATLLINDYRTDPEYEKLIRGLVDEGSERLYDAIGIQSHMHHNTWSNGKTWDVCERFSKFGVPLHFTEITILSGAPGWEAPEGAEWATTPEGEAYQAREVVRFYTMLFSHPAVEAITWWDFSDYRAWKQAPAGLIRKDMSPKPAYLDLMKLIKGKWSTRETLETDESGKAEFRGFLGDYTVRASKEGRGTTDRFAIRRDTDNNILLVAKPLQ